MQLAFYVIINNPKYDFEFDESLIDVLPNILEEIINKRTYQVQN